METKELTFKVGDVLKNKLEAASRKDDKPRKPSFNTQDTFLNQWRRDKVEVQVLLLSGASLRGRIAGFDNFSIILEGGGNTLIYKHGIATIAPLDKNPPGRGSSSGGAGGDGRG